MQSLKFTGTFVGTIRVRIDAEKVERLKEKTTNGRQKKTFILIRLRSASVKYT